jgi:hypothetical protein
LTKQVKASGHEFEARQRAEPAVTGERAEYDDEVPTRTDRVELEAARIRSSFSTPPVPMTPSAEISQLAEHRRRLGGFDLVPVVVVSAERLVALSLDGRGSLLVPLLDGRSTIQAVLDIGVMSPLDALAGLEELLARRIIELRPPETTR